MKFRQPLERKRGLRGSEVLRKAEGEPDLSYAPDKLFNPKRWETVVEDLLHVLDVEGETRFFSIEGWFQAAEALAIINPKKLEELRVAVRGKKDVLLTKIKKANERDPTVMAELARNAHLVWLLPELKEEEPFKGKWKEIAHQAKLPHAEFFEYKALISFVDPDKREEIGLNEAWLAMVRSYNKLIDISPPEVFFAAFTFFDSGDLLEGKNLQSEKAEIEEYIRMKTGETDTGETPLGTANNRLPDTLVLLAQLRLLLAEKVELKDGQYIITDRTNRLSAPAPLPERLVE